MDRGRTVALVVAGGSGARMGGELPKQYARIGRQAVLAHTIDALAGHPGIDEVRVVIGASHEEAYRAAIGGRVLPPPVIGGAVRRASVAAGLAAIDGERVLIHDAARPFLPPEVIDRLLDALDEGPGVVPVLPVADTLAEAGPALGATVSRAGLVRVQTPQAFYLDLIRAAHAAWDDAVEATDDAQMLRAIGLEVRTVVGDRRLEKLTFKDDIMAAEARLTGAMVSCTGMGFDVHAFAPGDHVWIGGIRIAHGAKLEGHSDADVGLHAITDALLGAIAMGDIGDHFPPSDSQWKDADSCRFLEHARELALGMGGVIDHVDLTVICEVPRIGPHRAAMRTRIANLLRLPEARISVKATTTERLGFTGRGEGIAAQAVATVRLPEDR